MSVPALLRPSIATPFTMDASPMIETTRRPLGFASLYPSPLSVSPRAMPTAVEIAVPAWPTEKRSYGLSRGSGKPAMPPRWRSFESSGYRPVSSLCG